ncbi:MAG: hypothetical protein HRU15_08200, partial [Planctomycetes bacterium]|nr:hypothetical protein [Planctomycetota bacterium]
MARKTGRATGTGGRGNTRRGTANAQIGESGRGSGNISGATRRGTKQTQTQTKGNDASGSKRKSIVDEEDMDAVGGRAKSGTVEARSSLRGKFMGTMAGLTAVTLVFLGGLLVFTSSSFVNGISMHKGVELAKMTAMVVRAKLDNADSELTAEELASEVTDYITGASQWKQGDDWDLQFSDILNVTLNGTKISGIALKGTSTGGTKGKKYPQIFVPRIGNVHLG